MLASTFRVSGRGPPDLLQIAVSREKNLPTSGDALKANTYFWDSI
jgi:hypothetical protein